MPAIEGAVDNDVLIKSARYDLLPEIAAIFGSPDQIAVLGAARYVVSKRLTGQGQADASAADAFSDFLAYAIELEPSPQELELATQIEEAGQRADLELDSGESQLCAIALTRAIPVVLTGDKRAVSALEAVLADVPACAGLAGRLVCFEQAIATLIMPIGAGVLRQRICGQSSADSTMRICFSCSSAALPLGFDPIICLESYIRDIRITAPTVLHPAAGSLR